VALVLLLRAVQHLAFGAHGQDSFLEEVAASSHRRRVYALAACGAVAALGWWALARWAAPLVSIEDAVGPEPRRLPLFATSIDAVLQIVTAGLGSPLGREAAPRALAAAVTDSLAVRAGLSAAQTRILVACSAGAGLAAVYGVPLAGSLFTLEVVLASFALPALVPAIATSGLAALVARICLGDEAQYRVPSSSIGVSLCVFAIVSGPVFALVAHEFARGARYARAYAQRSPRIFVWCLPTFLVIGALAIPFPQLLGNGQSPAQLGFDGQVGLVLATALLLLRFLAPIASLGAGATGGLLTPSMAVGALLAVLLGAGWNHVWPGSPSGAYAVVGAAAFLAVSARMPLTAIALTCELTRVGRDFYVPILLGVASSSAFSLFRKRVTPRVQG
jgi:H+/Cl- antiporter ClcA